MRAKKYPSVYKTAKMQSDTTFILSNGNKNPIPNL